MQMKWVLVEPCRKYFIPFLARLLSEEHAVTIFCRNSIRIRSRKGGDGVMLCCTGARLPRRISVNECIYLPMGRKKIPKFTGKVSVVHADRFVFLQEAAYYPCGFSAGASLSISSKSEEQVVISLLREAESLYGRRICPFELPVQRVKNITDTELLMAYMVKLLLYPT